MLDEVDTLLIFLALVSELRLGQCTLDGIHIEVQLVALPDDIFYDLKLTLRPFPEMFPAFCTDIDHGFLYHIYDRFILLFRKSVCGPFNGLVDAFHRETQFHTFLQHRTGILDCRFRPIPVIPFPAFQHHFLGLAGQPAACKKIPALYCCDRFPEYLVLRGKILSGPIHFRNEFLRPDKILLREIFCIHSRCFRYDRFHFRYPLIQLIELEIFHRTSYSHYQFPGVGQRDAHLDDLIYLFLLLVHCLGIFVGKMVTEVFFLCSMERNDMGFQCLVVLRVKGCFHGFHEKVQIFIFKAGLLFELLQFGRYRFVLVRVDLLEPIRNVPFYRICGIF